MYSKTYARRHRRQEIMESLDKGELVRDKGELEIKREFVRVKLGVVQPQAQYKSAA
jgi:hypothetical protein